MTQLKGASVKPEPTCYKLETGILGINFELPGKSQLFAPYSFLSHVQMKNEKEISLHYTYGVVRVVGHHLQYIYELAKKHNLGMVRPSEINDPCRSEIEIREIVFEDASTTANDSI
jgi:hypothetical protein